jgi:hypothetical protein
MKKTSNTGCAAPARLCGRIAATLLLAASAARIASADSPYPVGPDWACTVVADPSGGGYHYNPGNIPFSYGEWANDVANLSADDPIVFEFDHDVLDDALNPHGLDFIVFPSFYGKWQSGRLGEYSYDSEDVDATYDLNRDADFNYIEDDQWQIRVSVSRDGETWYAAPTLATRQNTAPVLGMPANADGTWGPDTSDFLWPVDREAYRQALAERGGIIDNVALTALYKTSAGGIAFDLKEFLSGSGGPTNAAGQLAIRFVKLELAAETEKGYVAIAGASDVRPVDLAITDFAVSSADSTIGGHPVTHDLATFSCSLPPGWSASGLFLTAADAMTGDTYRFPVYPVDSAENPDGTLAIQAIAPLAGQNLQFFRLGLAGE